MMTVPQRAAPPSQQRYTLPALRSFVLLTLLALFGGFASAQSLSPGGPVEFGLVQMGNTSGTSTLRFSAPSAGITIQSVTAVTGGALNKDFSVVSNTCSGYLHSPGSCTIELSFSPTQLGIRLGALNIIDNNNKVTNTVYLSGVGIGQQFVFAPTTVVMTASAAAISPAVFKSGAAVEDGNGNLFFTDVTNGRILERSDLGVYSQVATLPVSATSGIAMDGTGTLYVSAGSSVYAFMPGSTPQVLPMPSSITLGSPAGLAIDLAQDLYIADNTRNVIYQIPLGSSTGATLTITGPGVPFLGPAGLDVDASNNLYIADSGHDRIVEVPLSSLSSTVLTLSSLTLSNPTGVAVDAAGTVYIANTGGGNVIESTVTGSQFILTETSNTSAPHPLPTVTPTGIVIQPSGDLVISDTTQGLIDVARSTPAVNFPTPTVVGTLDSTDDPETLTVQSSGNITADLALSPTTTNPSISTNAFLLATTGNCPILAAGAALTPADSFVPGEVCTYDINFKPTVVGLNSANLILATTAAKGALTASTTVPLTGIGLSTIKSFKLVAIPSTINKGGTVQLILTALNADGTTVATDYVGTVTFSTTDSTGLFQFGTSPSTNTTTYTFTAADNGVLNVTPGLQLNQYGVYTASATDGTYSATSNNIFVIEPTTLTLTSSINPSLVNQSTTFTLNVATSGGLAPTGTVTFYSNGVQIGSPVTLSAGGTASINDSFPAAGNYAITATFTPSNSTQGGTASLTQVVGLPTAVVLTSSINPSLVNQSTNLTATISAIASPTGSVTFYNGATALGTVTVTGTTATLPVSFATAGTYPLTAVYTTTSTNPDVTTATSPILDQVVQNTSSLTFTSSVNPSQPNQSTTLTANLTALGSPTGTIQFYDGATLIGTVNVSGPTASLSVSFATPGTHPLRAVYSGNTLTASTTATLAQVVLNFSTVNLTSSVNPSLVGQSTTLTASLTASGTPTGTMKFYDGATLIGTATLTGATASVSVSFSTVGTHPLTAVYSGDPNTTPGTSAPLPQTVLNLATVALTSSANPALLDNPVIFSAILTSTGPAPTGTVSLFDGSAPLGVATLVNGTAGVSATFVYAGPHTITAVYSGDTVTASASAPALTETVADFSFTASSSSGSTIAGGTASYSLVLTPLITTTLPSAVTFTVTGLPTTATFVLTPTSVAAGSGATPVAFNVTAAQIVAAVRTHLPPAHRSPARFAPVALAFLALPLAWFRRRKRFGSLLASVCLLLAITGGLTGCISDPASGYYGQTPQSYNVTVTATSGNLARSTYLTLTIH